MTLFGYNIDLTWNLFLTAVLIPCLGAYLARLIRKSDQLQDERHENVVGAIDESKKAFMAKLDNHCAIQEKLHKQIDERFWKHAHNIDENGKITEDIVIKGGA